jgi:uncharacterized protein YdeI (YjbR/CyaY-like superfamily)
MSIDFSNLKRQKHPMPDFIKMALDENGLTQAYQERPAYQQNDYIGWIIRAKRQETKLKRLQQMLDELKEGGVYMNMKHPASTKKLNKF